MTTVPQPTRLAHLSAELFGTEDDTIIAWQQACTAAAEALTSGQPGDPRLSQALQLAHDGHVELEDDGSALVESRGAHYTVTPEGLCHCPDAHFRGGPCKHALAVQLHQAAAGLRLAPPAPAAEPDDGRHGWQPKTAARWDVHEAPASACLKFRVGGLELLYTFRGQSDAEVLPRLTSTLPTLQALLEGCEAQAEARREARTTARVAAPATPAPSAPAGDLAALLHAALAALHAQVQEGPSGQPHGTPNGHASPEPSDQDTGVCSLHQAAMELHRDPQTGETWRSHQCEATGRFCKGAKRPRPHGPRR